MKQSIIYSNIYIYRLLMNVLYFGQYKKRFKNVVELIQPNTNSVIELCFGDTFIAKYCQSNGICWKGFDLNEKFVASAIHLGLDAYVQDIMLLPEFPKCHTYIITGSLYHFKEKSAELIHKLMAVSEQVIISEPIKNLSTKKGLIGFIARKSGNAGKGTEAFRFDETSFLQMMDSLHIHYKVISIDKDILIQIKK